MCLSISLCKIWKTLNLSCKHQAPKDSLSIYEEEAEADMQKEQKAVDEAETRVSVTPEPKEHRERRAIHPPKRLIYDTLSKL